MKNLNRKLNLFIYYIMPCKHKYNSFVFMYKSNVQG